ncbi:polymer-forming cytoskeletal protein [Chakrabartia godavariana]|nr:polymer-forming cytoskeletal protein [Chakrabartia godavariana]
MSFIGSEVSITGNIGASGDIHLDGAVQGDVACGSLTVGASGQVRGNVLAQRATIAGAIEGSVVATELVIEKSARIAGDVSYESISIETGARVDGRLSQKAAPSGELKLVSAGGE